MPCPRDLLARSEPLTALPGRTAAISAQLAGIVDGKDYPCLGARSAFHQERVVVSLLGELGTLAAARDLLEALSAFAATTDPTGGFASFVAVFEQPTIESEAHFEELMWRQLQLVHDADEEDWAKEVSHDPADHDFAFSAAGTPYFIVGLHPLASRLARRTPHPTIVFNLHSQFEALRSSGRYLRLRDAIRARDERLQGMVNPMVHDHGSSPSARQYSGRSVGDEWAAPFRFRARVSKAA